MEYTKSIYIWVNRYLVKIKFNNFWGISIYQSWALINIWLLRLHLRNLIKVIECIFTKMNKNCAFFYYKNIYSIMNKPSCNKKNATFSLVIVKITSITLIKFLKCNRSNQIVIKCPTLVSVKNLKYHIPELQLFFL